MRKVYVMSGFLIVILIAGLWFWDQKKHFFHPKVTFSILQVRDVSSSIANLRVNNQIPFRLNFDHIDFRILANDHTLLETNGKSSLKINAFGKSSFEMPVKVHLDDIKRIAGKSKNDSTEYLFKAMLIRKGSLFLPDSLEIVTQQRLPTFHLPQVSLVKIQRDKLLKKGGPTFFLDVLIENKNNTPMEILDASYAVLFEDKEVLFEGVYPHKVYVEPKSSKQVQLHVQMDKNTILKHTGKLLFNKKELEVRIVFKGLLATSNPYIDGCNVTIIIKGDFKELTSKK
jgi:LEA14-like dessication related protein